MALFASPRDGQLDQKRDVDDRTDRLPAATSIRSLRKAMLPGVPVQNPRSPANRVRTAASSPDLLTPGAFLTERALHLRQLSVEQWGEEHAIEMVGFCPQMVELQTKLDKIGRYREPVLITGESGVGKEWFATAVYLLSNRRGRPLISVNCPQFQQGDLTVSELFGHTKGSFTGAIADRRGAFEEADGGVAFLDEVGDLHVGAQAMLLRALATGEYKPLGATRPRTADVRVVAATNRNLNQLVLVNQFRQDLLFRLWQFHLAVPALRERGNDWRVILEYYLLRLCRRHGVEKRFSTSAMKMLENYQWPGNVRQLISIVTVGYAMADGDTIETADFVSEIEKHNQPGDSADTFFERIATDTKGFWELVYQPFINRDLNRAQVKAIIRRGLAASEGNYRRLLDLLHLPTTDYQRFMDFLRHHDLKP
jgi:DNA-binding NtrC family response regulator